MKNMGRAIFTLFLVLMISNYLLSQETVIYEPGTIYKIQLGQILVVELPEGFFYSISQSEKWDIKSEGRFVFVQPKIDNDMLLLEIRTDKNLGVTLMLKSVQEEQKIMKLIVQELKDLGKKIVISQQSPETPPPAALAPVSTLELGKREKQWEILAGASGGIFGIGGKSNFTITGEIAGAGKLKSGLFGQAAGFLDLNSFMKRYGASLGAGWEPDNFGFFLFGDLLNIKLSDYEWSTHVQLRPGIRYRTDRIHLSGFYAFALTKDQWTGVDDPEDPTMGVFNRAVNHIGLDFSMLLMDRLILRANGIIGGSNVYKIGGGIEFNLYGNLNLVANVYQANYGEFPLMLNSEMKNSFEFRLGVNVGFGSRLKFKEQKSKILFPRDYPLVVNELQKKDPNAVVFSATLVAQPTEGYAPLTVNTTVTPIGGTAPYSFGFFWTIGSGSTPENIKMLTFDKVGQYDVYCEVTDNNGLKAKTNTVTITVKQPQGQMWNITVSAGPGGTVDPGSCQVPDSQDSPVFNFTASSGYDVDYVLVDGQNFGKIYSHQFKAVHADHTLNVFFRSTAPNPSNKYTIDASAGTGLAINPSGTKQYNAGENADYTVTITDTSYEIFQVLVDGAAVATNPTAPYTYHFGNIQANHTINAVSRKKQVTITATAGPNGTINPAGAVKVDYGSSPSFSISANQPQYTIDTITVDGAAAVTSPGDSYTYNFTGVTADHTIHATFKIKTFTIRIWPSTGNGHTNPGVGTYTVNYGGSLAINNIPDAGQSGVLIHVNTWTEAYVPTYTFTNVNQNYDYWVEFTSTTIGPWKVWVTEEYSDHGAPAGNGFWNSTYDNGDLADIYFFPNHPTKAGYFLLRAWVDGVQQVLDGSGGFRFNMQMFQDHEIRVLYLNNQ